MALNRHGEQAAAASMIEQLPADVMVRVMKFVDVPRRVTFSTCSKRLQKLVCKECVPLWTDIDLSDVKPATRLRLTDKMLSSLLTRVNAWSVTRTLNVAGCNKLKGTFLDSLICSRTLEKLYLQQSSWPADTASLDESVAVRYLRSMLPFKLSLVRFQWEVSDRPCVAADFLRELRAARLQDAQDQRLKCSACKQSVADTSRQIVMDATGMPSLFCGACKHPFCRRGSCPIGLTQCRDCVDAFCDDCQRIGRCDVCKHSYCKECNPIEACSSCSKNMCECCRDDLMYCCVDCDKLLCDDCNREPDTSIGFCGSCEVWVCGKCRQTGFCDMCDERLCEKCVQVKQCSICSHGFCMDCRKVYLLDCCQEWACVDCVPLKRCNRCRKTFCASERVEKCDACNNTLCDDCAEVRECGHCSGSFCVYCRELVFFDGSEETFCVGCKTPARCDGCAKKFCTEQLERCGGCHKSFCAKCREMEHCEGCSKSFCNDDCAFVDRCTQCETRYCEGCALVVRCPWCGEASCEKCRRNGGCCRMCSEKPAKKARISS